MPKEFEASLVEIVVAPESTGLVYLAKLPDDLIVVDEQEALIRANHSPHAVTPGIEEDGETLRWDAEWTHDQKTILGEGLSMPPSIAQAFDFQPLIRFSLGRYGKVDMVGIDVQRDTVYGHLVSPLYSEKAFSRVAQILRNALRTDELSTNLLQEVPGMLSWEATWGRGKPSAHIINTFFQTNPDRRLRSAGVDRTN